MFQYTIEFKIINKLLYKKNLLKYATPGSAGIDLYAVINKKLIIKKYNTILIPTGIAIFIKNKNIAGMIIPRSGLGHKNGIILGNTVGLIDSDFQGEIKISCWNRTNKDYIISPFQRICQLIIIPIVKANFKLVLNFKSKTKRGKSGYGSTGL